jgi:hypothetical protein
LPISFNGTTGLTFADNSTQITASKIGMVNRIINGGMIVDQRNNGASVTIANTGGATYVLDRWFGYGSQLSRFSVQRNAGSVTPPAGFINYLGVTSISTSSLGAGDQFIVGQYIEGFNTADLAWGTANAKAVTVSFWVRSSLTGTFGGSLTNDGFNRSYPFNYTISSANTWEQKSITIAGDTTGTWQVNTSTGIRLNFGLGVGTNLSGTANAWSGSTLISATGAVSVVGTNGATFYITGVQLEVGSTATPFDYQDYSEEFRRCRRYFRISRCGSAFGYLLNAGYFEGTTTINFAFDHSEMRTAPTVSTVGTFNVEFQGGTATLIGVSLNGTMFCRIGFSSSVAATIGQASHLRDAGSNNSRILFSSEL